MSGCVSVGILSFSNALDCLVIRLINHSVTVVYYHYYAFEDIAIE